MSMLTERLAHEMVRAEQMARDAVARREWDEHATWLAIRLDLQRRRSDLLRREVAARLLRQHQHQRQHKDDLS